jgi:tetratricopeptide (TPR) repeat protein
MSLLMDALKKAERAKRGQSRAGDAGLDPPPPARNESTAADQLTLEPLATPSAISATAVAEQPDAAADLPSQLEALDEAFLAEIEKTARRPGGEGLSIAPLTESRRAAAPTGAGAAAAAQNLFAAKLPAAAPRNNRFMLGLAGLTALAVIGIGGYFWWRLQPRRSGMLPVASNAVSPAPTFVSSPPSAVQPAPDVAPTAPTHVANSAPVVEDEDEEHEVARPLPKAPPVAVAHEERLLRPSGAPLRIDPALSRGYAAFNRGELAAARGEYLRAQQDDPNNTDALHGLAAIALRENKPEQAAATYRKILEINPQDAVALAALLDLRGQANPADAEDELKSLTAAQPELAAPELSLGNLYARQGRWPEAQQAYFRAYTAEPDNPDLLYNLAVSLEHLRQPKLAAQYYAQALAAAASHPATFDQTRASSRLRALSP